MWVHLIGSVSLAIVLGIVLVVAIDSDSGPKF